MMRYKKFFLFILLVTVFLFPVILAPSSAAVFAQSVEQNNEADVLFKEGCSLIAQKKYSEATKVLERVVELNSKKRGAYTNLTQVASY